MSFGDSYDTKQRIRQAIDIVDLVGGYLPLRREGRAFKALCPWHDDTHPSLTVNPERQSFRCWVCDIGGDIFSFVMRMEGVEFPEALAMLADRANVSLNPAARGETRVGADNKRLLYQAMAWADFEYHSCLLNDPVAQPARDYLAGRHITAESIRRFQLGFAPDDWNWLSERARGTPYSSAVLERIGLISPKRNGPGYYDRFKGRVLFPIFDPQGGAVGLGGRVLPPLAGEAGKDVAKYVNSPETPLFAKGNLLYGLHLARDAIRKTGSALVVEGYTDCIAAHQFGFENTVAVLGTALGAGHVRLLRRFADRIRVVLVLDGDEAGRRRAAEVLELFVSANVDLRVLTLPANSDPADFLQAHGAGEFERLLAGAADALAHAFRAATEGIDLQADVHAASAALEQLVATIAKAPRLRADTMVEDRLREERFLQRLAADFRVSETQVRTLMTKLRRKAAPRQPAAPPAEDAASVHKKIDPLERELLELLLQSPQTIEQVAGAIQPAQFVGEACRRVVSHCVRLWSAGILPEFTRLLLEIDDPAIKNLLVELDESGRGKPPAEADVRLRDVLAGFERRPKDEWLRDRTHALQQRQIAKEDEAGVLKELEEYLRARDQQQRSRLGISELTEGQDAQSAG
ncbi:MAG: DNA primase [Pirellulales bacterium]